MASKLPRLALIVGGLWLIVPMAGAQEANSAPSQPLALSGPQDVTTSSPMLMREEVVADTLSLAGAQNVTLGKPAYGHGFLLPSFGVATTVQTNPYYSGKTSPSGVVDATYLTGRLDLNRSAGHSDLSLDYLGGGVFSNDPILGTSGIQSLRFADSIGWGRWSALFGDQLSYTSQSPFGFGGLGGTHSLGVGLGNGPGSSSQFKTGLLPNQSILIYGPSQLSNAAIGEVDYSFTHRSSLTFAGAYDKLHFLTGTFLDSEGVVFQGGYNYQLDRFNSVALLYRFDNIKIENITQSLQDQSAQLSFARRVTGRLGVQLSAGPDLLVYAAPLAGPKTVLSWTASASLKYRRQRLNAGLSYDHVPTGGSGVLLGAVTDVLWAYVGQPIHREWDATATTGYSMNHALRQTTPNAGAIALQAWFTTLQFTRHFSGYGSFYFSYSASGQTGLASVCTQPGCLASSLNHTIGIGYNWGLRPRVFE